MSHWLLLLLFTPCAAQDLQEYSIGWQAPYGAGPVLQQYGETWAAVSQELGATFTIVPYMYDSDLQAAANNGSLQFVFGGPALVYCIILSANVQPLATVINGTAAEGTIASVLSGSIIVPVSSPINHTSDLVGAVLAVGQYTGLTTFQAESGLLLAQGMNVFADSKALVEYGSSAAITTAVLEGYVDAGFVPTTLQPPGVRVLDPKQYPDQRLPSTTPPYSAQVLAAASGISEQLRTDVVRALISIDQGILSRSGYSGWNVPRSFVDIRRLAQSTGLLKSSGESCSLVSDLYSFITCQAGFQRRADSLIAGSCNRTGFVCPAGATSCICSPCEAIRYPRRFGTLSARALAGVVLACAILVVLIICITVRCGRMRPFKVPWIGLSIHADRVLGHAKGAPVVLASYCGQQVVLKRAYNRDHPVDFTCPEHQGFGRLLVRQVIHGLLSFFGYKTTLEQRCCAVSAQEAFNHSNIVKVHGVTTGPDGLEVIAVLELATKGTLLDLLQNPSVDMSMSAKLRLALDVAQGLMYLHGQQRPQVGRKLRTHHLLLTENYVCKVNTCFTDCTGKGRSRFFMAPEALRGDALDTKTDVYAFGILLWEIVHRQQVYEGEDMEAVLSAVQKPSMDTDLMRPVVTCTDLPPEVECLLTSCLAEEAHARPQMSEVVDTLKCFASESFAGNLMLETRQQESLLRQILPEHVVKALKEGRTPSYRQFDMVTVYFNDIQGFTTISSTQDSKDVYSMLDDLYTKFDGLCRKHGLMKVETIGDSCALTPPSACLSYFSHVA